MPPFTHSLETRNVDRPQVHMEMWERRKQIQHPGPVSVIVRRTHHSKALGFICFVFVSGRCMHQSNPSNGPSREKGGLLVYLKGCLYPLTEEDTLLCGTDG